MKIKWIIYGLLALIFIGYSMFRSGDSSSSNVVNEEVVTPTQGIITTVKEVEADEFRIEDEQIVDSPEDSRIIAKYMDNTVDTFTLAEAQMASDTSNSQYRRRNPVARMAYYGLMGYFMGRSMGSHRPHSSAYVDQNTYNRVTNNAGQSMQRTARRTSVSRPSSGKSGYGGSRSTRSYGG